MIDQASPNSHCIYILRKVVLLTILLIIGACTSAPKINKNTSINKNTPDSIPKAYTPKPDQQYQCNNASSFAGRKIGDGTCVSLIKHCSNAPDTRYWKAGEKVLSLNPGTIPFGTVIATFKNGKYPNMTGYHAAIYIRHDQNGIWVWDQWVGKPVHQRLIRIRYDQATASNSAQAYRIVK